MLVRSRFAGLVVAILIAVSQPPLSAAPVRVYRTQDLGFVAGGSYLVGVAINANGDAAGYANGADGVLRAFRWTAAGGPEDLSQSSWQSSMAFAINDNGDVVGRYWDHDWADHPFIARRGESVTDLVVPYPDILGIDAINDAGQLTGYTRSGPAFRTQPGGALQELSTYFGFGAGINEAGEVAGVGWHDAEQILPQTAFRYSDATGFVDLGTLSGGASGARAINESGVIVGWSGSADGVGTIPTHVFRSKPGMPMEDLGGLPGGFLGGAAAPSGLNDRGAIVGQSDGRFGWSPFLYTDAHGMIDLRERITTTERQVFSMDAATAINNAGQILAGYNGPAGAYGTVLLTPVRRDFDGPVAAPTAEPAVLRRVDNRMVSVSVDPHVTDEYDPEPACRIVRVLNSQAPRSGRDRDVEITNALSVNLGASRSGPGNSRSYTITLGCTDSLGVTSRSEVVVVVHQEHGRDD